MQMNKRQLGINVLKLIGWLMFGRIMVLPIYISYLFTKKPSLSLQLFLAVICIILGCFSVGVLYRNYRQNLAQYNPHHFDSHLKVTRQNLMTWVVVMLIFLVEIIVSKSIDHMQMLTTVSSSTSNVNSQVTDSFENVYSLAFPPLLNVFGPICEELTLRGQFFAFFLKSDSRLNQIVLWLINGLLFMLIHGSLMDFAALHYLVWGLSFGGVYLMTRNLQYSIFGHVMISSAMSIFDWLGI